MSGRPPRASITRGTLRRGALPALVGLLALSAPATAQTSSIGVIAGEAGASVVARLAGVRDGASTVDAWARVGRDVGFGVVWRYTEVFGPLGNVIVEGGTDLLLRPDRSATDAEAALAFRASLGARGVVGPVAAALRLDAGTAPEDAFDGTLRPEATRAAVGAAEGAWDAGARLGLTWRIDRATSVSIDPRLRWVDGSVGAFALGSLRRSGLRDDLDLWLGVEGGTLAGRSAAAVGVGPVWTRRREPDSWLRVWLGADGTRALPGAEVLLAGRRPGSAVTIAAAWVPHRLDAHAWRVSLEASDASPAPSDGTWRLRAAVAGGAGASPGAATRSAGARHPAAASAGARDAGGVTFSLSVTLERAWSGAR